MIYDLYHVRVALVGLWLLISLKHGGRALLNLRWKLFLQNITQKGKQQMHIMKPCNIKNWCHAFLGSFDSHQQKNNLVFHGIEPDKMERDMAMVGQKQRHGNDWLLFDQCWLKRENPWMKTFLFPGTWLLSGHLGDTDKNAFERASKNIAGHFLFQGGSHVTEISFCHQVARVPNAPEDAKGAKPIIACFTNFKVFPYGDYDDGDDDETYINII